MDDLVEIIATESKKRKRKKQQRGAAPESIQAPGEIDLDRLAELVVEKMRDELVIENERTGRS
jgi:hypothetical protein